VGRCELGAGDGHDVVTAHALLPPAYREALALRELERMPCAEIALVLGIGRAGAAALAWRAREALHPACAVARAACAEARTALELAADGDAPAPWVAAHLRACRQCRQARAAWAAVSAAYRTRLGVAPAPAGGSLALHTARERAAMH
jgi:hypothetical protein